MNLFCKAFSVELTEEEKTNFPNTIPLTKESIPTFIGDMISILENTGLLITLSLLKEEDNEGNDEIVKNMVKKSLIDFYHLLFNLNELEKAVYPLIDFDSIKDDENEITQFESDKTKS